MTITLLIGLYIIVITAIVLHNCMKNHFEKEEIARIISLLHDIDYISVKKEITEEEFLNKIRGSFK